MQHLPLWYITSIPYDICDAAREDLGAIPSQNAAMGIDGKTINKIYRDTVVRFANSNHWLEIYLRNVVFEANEKCDWQYIINGNENIQYAEYGTQQHYNWHVDVFPLSGKDIDRKITVVALLNDEFAGGDFEMRLYQDYKVPLKKGSIVAFPSIIEHRVTPITSGKRYSATMWFNGPRFR